MSDSDEQLEKTRNSAYSFLEDYEYLCDLVGSITPKKGDLRRASAIVRRWLVDGSLQAIASPRVGRIEICAPDCEPFVISARKKPFAVFVSARTNVFGVYIAAGTVDEGRTPRQIPGLIDPSNRNSMRIDTFRKQKVIYFEGEWITRNEVIKYVANIGDGVHSGTLKTDAEKRIASVRHAMTFALVDPKKDPNRPKEMPDDVGLIPCIKFNPAAGSHTDLAINYDPDSIDCVLVELLAIIRFVVESPNVKTLRMKVQKEAKL